ncbi:glutamate receptor 2.7-like isoform X2 [Prosopis cineraria]|uniref:glutamate receptor 2.7-like isoform X2 n=1 Tax=Prosopis cineraria TaxID=364024 RepID=UPI00240F32D4|nr:glutamate receptor 2.7-like isoform X2 [Prosopis cineraria]
MNIFFTIPKALPRFWLFFLLLISCVLLQGYGDDESAKGDTKVIRIGAIIDVNSRIGKEQQLAMEIEAQNYNKTSKTHKLALYFQNATKEAFRVTSLAEELIEMKQVEVIIGMHTWQEAALVAEIGSQAQVPIISFASPAITPPLTPKRWPYLVRLANNVTAQVKCIAGIVNAFSWQRVVVVYEDDGYGGGDDGMLSLLSEALRDFGSLIEYRLALPPISILPDPGVLINEELIKLVKQSQSRVFIVLHSSLEMVTHFFRESSKMGLVDRDSAWIISESITNLLDSLDKSVISSYMGGSLGIKTHYSENSGEYQDFRAQFRKKFRAKNPEEDNSNPGFYALQAYDSIKVVIQAVERMERNNSSSTEALLREILSSSFLGLSGEIHFEAGQLLQNPILRMVNVVGKSYKEIDFWTQENGFTASLPTGKSEENATANTQSLAGVVQWPGNLQRTPKGWNMPIKRNPLKIAVPGRTSFSKFVKVEYGKSPDQNQYSGFCIEIFNKVLELLEYDLPYEFYPLNVTYPDLVQLVYNKTYDAVVGDMTLLAERLQYVDFTVPYAESGLSMIVPVKSEDSTWMFLKPFTWQMWAVTGAILIYTMSVVWYLEQEPNPEFQGNWKRQFGTALWFTFSSLFFAHREQMHGNLSRVVMGAWLLLVMVLTSSYTASLSSMLTVQQLQPNVTSIEWLKMNNMKIGCDGDSFVRTYLEKVERFSPKNIINISSEYYYDGEFKNNSIAAAFLELPYEKVYISTYCKMFQKGSPVAKDVSKAILQLSEKGELTNLEAKWLYHSNECTNNSTSNDTQSLKLENFWVLFVISGVTSTICLLFSIIQSQGFCQLTQNGSREGNGLTSDITVWIRAVELAKRVYSRTLIQETQLYGHTIGAQQDLTNCSSRWDYVSTTDSTMHQQDTASPVSTVIVLSSPPPETPMETPDNR